MAVARLPETGKFLWTDGGIMRIIKRAVLFRELRFPEKNKNERMEWFDD